MAEWTQESKDALIKAYKDKNPTGETSTEIVAELAKDFEVTVNGVRAILVKAEVYVKKAPATSKAKGNGDKKESKTDSLARLTTVINAQGLEASEEIINKLTGKAAAYFADTITKITKED